MTEASAVIRTARALVQRLAAVHTVLLPEANHRPEAPGSDAGEPHGEVVAALGRQAGLLLADLTDHLTLCRDTAQLWLVLSALAAAYPTGDELRVARRRLDTHTGVGLQAEMLLLARQAMNRAGQPDLELDVVGGVIVDVDFCARHVHNTGIQRVVRATMPWWDEGRDCLLVGWTDRGGCYRYLTADERTRVVNWGSHVPPPEAGEQRQDRMILPWQARVVLAENPHPSHCDVLAALGFHSGNGMSAVGYDCIPVVSPELVAPGLPQYFAHSLHVMKACRTIAGISRSATAEYRGFAAMMPAQGLTGPRVEEVMLPMDVPAAVPPLTHAPGPPVVLSVGSFEPRKNQLAVLVAAERLWREGLSFTLQFVGGGGYRTEFDEFYERLRRRGRPVRIALQITDEQLWDLYRQARFSVFTSLHEGYGLPVAESLGFGVPVLTTNYGSTAEIAELGGVLTVDPRDDEAITSQMRRLILDDALVADLRAQAAAAPRRSWRQYADELWGQLVDDGHPVPAQTGGTP